MTEYKGDHPLVTALIGEVDRAVKQAMSHGGNYDTTVRFILNEHLRDDDDDPWRMSPKLLFLWIASLNFVVVMLVLYLLGRMLHGG